MGIHHHKINTIVDSSVFLIDGGNKKSSLVGATGIGKATRFSSGASQQLEADATDFKITNESFTIGTWIYRDSISPTEAFIGIWGGVQNYVLQALGNTLYFSVRNGSGGFAQPTISSAMSAGVWHFVVGVYDFGASLAKVSIDGGAFSTAACIGITPSAGSGEFNIASQQNTRYMSGRIDASFFYKGKALTLLEIQGLYNSGDGVDLDDLDAGQKTNLVAWWRHNETGLTEVRVNAHDVNPEDYDLTPVNNPNFDVGKVADESSTFVKDLIKGSRGFVPTNGIGAINGVFPFNGIDEWIDCGAILTEVNSDTVGTIEAWVRTDSLSDSQYIFSVSHSLGASDEYYVAFGINGSGQLRIVSNKDDGSVDMQVVTVASLANTTDFFHVVAVQDGVIPKLYINGNLEAVTNPDSIDNASWFNSLTTPANKSNISGLEITGNTPAALWDGDIRTCRYYSRVLTETEIKRNYLSQKHR